MVRIGTFLVALLLIVAGTVVFLMNFGYVSLFFIRQVIDFWPVLFVIIGLSFFWGGKIPRWLAFLIVIALVGGVIALAFAGDLPGHFPRSI